MDKISLDKTYEPKKYEDKIYESWQNSGFFNPDNLKLPEDAPTYTVILPPPNITDKLHLGHASMLAIEDLFIRYKRMSGFRTLWLPGTDHAAIATQSVVEKKLKQERGQTRHDLGKEEFLKQVWQFLNITQTTILKQIKKMGASLDWSRLAFTLDEKRQEAVKEMFVQMYEAGLIYRGERIVNWCPHCASTLADDEVDYQEQTAKLYTFYYAKNCPIAISTTRPETKLGDTAIAVNPSDERYKKYIGQTFEVDFCGVKLSLKVIGDHNVDMNFGTGALGVTPAHSMVDWQMAEANDLPIIKVINEHGLIHEGFGGFSGLLVYEVRELVVDRLRADGLLEKEETISNNLSLCYRCDTPIEPLPSKQWFVAVDKPVERLNNKSLKQAAIEVAEQGAIEFLPERFNKRYLDWMTNLRDWCISRQIWFGHELPVWYCESNNKQQTTNNKCFEPIVSREEPKSCPHCDGKVVRDGDTLDTWFSSGMWTFSTLDWPANFKDGQKSGDLAKFHPTQLMETGYELITLWVSRMIMMSLFAVGEIPFSKVYLHGMVLDERGKKMSKSKGNGIDPLDMIELYGTDAVRLSLLIGVTPGVDFKMSQDKIAGYRNFVNKFWNIARFILSKIDEPKAELEAPQAKTLFDQWILEELANVSYETSQGFDQYNFALAGEKLENFTWNSLADWYLEVAKIEGGKDEILNYILNILLKLWHPLMPFATEAIWREVYGEESCLMVEKWPSISDSLNSSADIEIVKNIVVGIRNARSLNKIAPSQKIKAVVYVADIKKLKLIEANEALIKGLRTGLSDLAIKKSGQKITDAIYFGFQGVEVYLIAEIDKNQEKLRLEKEFVRLEKYICQLEAKLDNQEFVDKAPADLVNKEKDKLAQNQQELEKIKEHLSNY